MYRHWEDELVILPVEVVEMIHPNLFNISWIHLIAKHGFVSTSCDVLLSCVAAMTYPTMAVCTVLDEHHAARSLARSFFAL